MASPDGSLRGRLAAALESTRQRTLALLAGLDDATVHEQHVEFLSPLVWDVGHVGNFEELWLLRQLAGRPPHDARLDELYNPFEQPRDVRGTLPLLDREAALGYLTAVREEALAVLAGADLDDHQRPLLRDGAVYRMIANHEGQHQETMLQALDLRREPVPSLLPPRVGDAPAVVDDEARVRVPAGPAVIGTDDPRDTYDNERPAHRVDVDEFVIDVHPVTARRFAAFVDDGGYARPELWSPRGREWLAETGERAPQGWVPDVLDGWQLRRFGHLRPLDPREPVQHLCWFEAEAFCRWAGGRLPTEVEWEKAATGDPATASKRRYPWGNGPPTAERANVGLRHLQPRPVGSHPAGASAYGVQGLEGDVYEWTSSPFLAYPGFVPWPYREYSEVFYGGDWKVLRGSSWAIPATMARSTYRNWDHPYRRQIMAGARVAYDASALT